MTMNFSFEFIMAHSMGGHVICEYMKAGCGNVEGSNQGYISLLLYFTICFRLIGMILLSPVDGVDEIGMIDNFCTTPGEKLNFDLPTLIMPAGLDGVPGKDVQLQCLF